MAFVSSAGLRRLRALALVGCEARGERERAERRNKTSSSALRAAATAAADMPCYAAAAAAAEERESARSVRSQGAYVLSNPFSLQNTGTQRVVIVLRFNEAMTGSDKYLHFLVLPLCFAAASSLAGPACP